MVSVKFRVWRGKAKGAELSLIVNFEVEDSEKFLQQNAPCNAPSMQWPKGRDYEPDKGGKKNGQSPKESACYGESSFRDVFTWKSRFQENFDYLMFTFRLKWLRIEGRGEQEKRIKQMMGQLLEEKTPRKPANPCLIDFRFWKLF